MKALVYWKVRSFFRFWKEFFRLIRIGINPVRLAVNCVVDGHWRAIVSSGNGDLYITGGYDWVI